MEGPELRRSRLPAERLGKAVAWALAHGCDTVLLEHDPEAVPFPADVVHHLCADSACPGGC